MFDSILCISKTLLFSLMSPSFIYLAYLYKYEGRELNDREERRGKTRQVKGAEDQARDG